MSSEAERSAPNAATLANQLRISARNQAYEHAARIVLGTKWLGETDANALREELAAKIRAHIK